MKKITKRTISFLTALICVAALMLQVVAADEILIQNSLPTGDIDITEEADSSYIEQSPEETDTAGSEEEISDEEAGEETQENECEEISEEEEIYEVVNEVIVEEETSDDTSENNDASEEMNQEEIGEEIESSDATEEIVIEEEIIIEEEIEETPEEEEVDIQADYENSLSKGAKGDEVLQLQKRLIKLGYLNVSADGIYGNLTEKAVKKFQLYNNMDITGTADKDTRKLIDSDNAESFRVLWKGAKGTPVLSLQKLLKKMGYLSASPDGIFGNYTEAALKKFQSDMGLSNPDGGFGNWTFEKLIENMDKTVSEDPEEESANSLKKGDSGADVKALQKKLVKLGFLSVSADGIYGNYTVRAVKKFQMYSGLSITGVADEKTVSAINEGKTSMYNLKKGSTGTAVLALQKLLKELGYLSATPDGIFGAYTEKAVVSFQSVNGIGNPDGIVGKHTLEILFNNPAAPGSSLQTGTIGYGLTLVITAGSLGALDVKDASVSNGAGVVLKADKEDYSQKWVTQDAGNGYYYICNLKSWKVLDISNGSLCQNDASGASSQKWKIVENGTGYSIINANGKYLTASSSGVSVAKSSTSKNQTWSFKKVDSGTALNFTKNGTQWVGIRSFNVNNGNVTETTGYYSIKTNIDLPSAGYYLSTGSNYSIGLKVMYVCNYLVYSGYLSYDYYNYERYDSSVAYAVMCFQGDCGITVDGVVGLQTWRAMGYSDYDFYYLGAYVSDLKVYAYGSSREAMVTAMLTTADEYARAGTGYRVGCSGAPGTYVDCSGLIYQCLYSAGINPETNIIDHARVVYEYTSAYLAADYKLGASVSDVQPGDLIFYGNSSVNHVAIYAGNGMIYDAYPGLGVTYRSMYIGTILKIVRVF